MKFPEKWDQPSWHLPINFPLQDATYFFGGLADSNTIFLDNDSTLFILFEDTLSGPNGGRVGIDSTFSSYFRIDGFETPDIEGVEIPPIDIGGFDSIFGVQMSLSDFGDGFEVLNCFPDILTQDIEPTSENFTQTIYNADEIEVFNSIDSVTVTEGLLSLLILNEFPFEISTFKLNMFTAGQPIWEVEVNNIGENESFESLKSITNNPIALKETILFEYEITIDPQAGNDNCALGTGWGLNGDFDRTLFVNFNLNFEKIGLIAGNLKEFSYLENYQIDIPNPDNIWLSGGLLSEGNSVNQLKLGFSNNLFSQIDIKLDILELFSYDNSSNDWTENYSWNASLDPESTREYLLYIENKMLKPSNNPSDTLKNLNLIFSGLIPSQDIEINPNIEYSFSVDTVIIEPIQLDYINAIFQEMDFSSPSIKIDDVPQGFSGFQFADVTLDLNIYNQIGVPVKLDMFLAGVKDNDTTFVPLVDSLFSPIVSAGFEINDILQTNIIMTGTHQISTWIDGEDIVKSDTIELNSSFLDIMNFAPSEIIVGGNSELKGAGTLAPETYVWGDFKFKLPLSFIFEEGMNIVPEVTTEMNSMNEESKDQIENGLVSANLNVSIENHSPLAMTISLLISTRDDFFPHYIDDLISGSLVTNQDKISAEEFDYLSAMNVGRIEVESLADNEEKALRVIFRDEQLLELFWVGRIADVTIPEAEEINPITGHVIKSGYGNDVIELSIEKMDWLTSNSKRYSRPMMEFVTSNGEPRTLRSTDYLKISSYVSIILNTGGI
jgi:hypothetical protein